MYKIIILQFDYLQFLNDRPGRSGHRNQFAALPLHGLTSSIGSLRNSNLLWILIECLWFLKLLVFKKTCCDLMVSDFSNECLVVLLYVCVYNCVYSNVYWQFLWVCSFCLIRLCLFIILCWDLELWIERFI